MAEHARALPLPPAAEADPQAFEAVRVWITGGRQHVSLRHNVWPDPAIWGLLLVDLARHVANALSQASCRDRVEVLARIKAGFDVEWAKPTDQPEGRVMDGDPEA
jgi:hypothetical protein